MFGKRLSQKRIGDTTYVLKEQSCFWVIMSWVWHGSERTFTDQCYMTLDEAKHAWKLIA